MFEPLLSPLFSPLFSSLIAAAQRVLITLNGTDAFYSVENILVFGSGDTFEFNWLAPAGIVDGTEVITDGDDANDRGKFQLLLGGTFNTENISDVVIDEVSLGATGTYPVDNKLHKVKLVFNAPAKIKYLGGRFNQIEFYSGIISNPKATISGVTTAWQLDRAAGNTEQAAKGNNQLTYVNIPTGAPDRELFTKNTSTDPDQWENADKSRIIQIA